MAWAVVVILYFLSLLVVPATVFAQHPGSSCTCYYGYDEECKIRDYVCTGGFDEELRCIRMKPKGGAWAGKCNVENDDPKRLIAPCDGTCKQKAAGSTCGSMAPQLVGESIMLWARAFTEPALAGGGPVDANLAAQARAVLIAPECSDYLGWRTMGVMELSRGNPFVIHPDPHEHDAVEDHFVIDIRGDNCRVQSGNHTVMAMVAGLADVNAVDPILDLIPQECTDGLPFGDTGLEGDSLAAVKSRIHATVEVLTTPAAK